MASTVESLLPLIIVALAAPVNGTGYPKNTWECNNFAWIPGSDNADIYVYDPTCPATASSWGGPCLGGWPCRFCVGHCQKTLNPTSTAECYDVPNINMALTMVYDTTCPGLNCFEDIPCRYDANACNVNVVLDATGDAEVQWAGQCKTLAECQDACSSWGCTAMNWWPKRGGCRLIKGATTPRTTEWTTISGAADCKVSTTETVAPSDCETCSSNCDRRRLAPSDQVPMFYP